MAKKKKKQKISCFVALPHHTRFMHPVLESIAKQKEVQIEYFTTAADFPFEKALIEKGKDCKILQDYIDDELREKITRSKADFYQKWSAAQFDWQGLRQWPVVLQTVMINDGITEYFLLEKYIQLEKPDLFVALHERNRWGKLIGHLARKYAIPYVTFQEGDYYEDRISFSAHTEYSTALLLWGRDTASRLTRLSAAAEKMVLTGNTHLNAVQEHTSHLKVRQELSIPEGKKVVLIMVGLQWGIIQDMEVWKKFLQGLDDKVVKVFKWHPKVNYRNFQDKILPMFKQHYAEAIVLQNYDPYELIKASDYCVTLGKTTLAVEALCLGKPVFSVAGTDGCVDHYQEMGVTQAIGKEGDWQALHETIDKGVPKRVEEKVKSFLYDYFAHNNQQAIKTSVEVIKQILLSRQTELSNNGINFEQAEGGVSDRISFILASGCDAQLLQMTVISLAEKVGLADWELIVVLQDEDIGQALNGVSGDLRYIEAFDTNLAQAFNQGMQVASGKSLIFLRAGSIYYGDSSTELEENVLYSYTAHSATDASLISHGQYFDFNGVPRSNLELDRHPELATKGMLSCSRELMVQLGGFDEMVADDFVETDLCLVATENGVVTKMIEPAFYQVVIDAQPSYSHAWKGRIHFFSKWQGRYKKDEVFTVLSD